MGKHKLISSASSRHAKITGDFAEALILYWLSRDGFECARVDHTGIDLIARNPHTGERMGISVKSRCRLREGQSGDSVRIKSDNFEKAKAACLAFGCKPYFAIVVDAHEKGTIHGFITRMDHLVKICPRKQLGRYWPMSEVDLQKHLTNPRIMSFRMQAHNAKWWKPQ